MLKTCSVQCSDDVRHSSCEWNVLITTYNQASSTELFCEIRYPVDTICIVQIAMTNDIRVAFSAWTNVY